MVKRRTRSSSANSSSSTGSKPPSGGNPSKKLKHVQHSHGPEHEQRVAKAKAAVQTTGLSIRRAALKYSVKKSTLSENLSRPIKPVGHPHALSAKEERALADHLILVSKWGFPLSRLDLAVVVKGYLDAEGREVKRFTLNLPGEKWVTGFLRRHDDLRPRIARNISVRRAKVGPDEIKKFFGKLSQVLAGVPPQNILNFDETNLTDDPASRACIFKRGVKYPEIIATSSKTAISLMFAGTAAGELLPPYVVYKSKQLWDSWTENGPAGARYNRSPSGWFDLTTLTNWFITIALPWANRTPGRSVIIGDNLSSHFSLEVLELCMQHDVSFVCLPPNATHLLQPLDVGFFRPLKSHWRDVLREWKLSARNRSLTLPKEPFPYLLQKLMLKIGPNRENNLKSAFRACGIVPCDESAVLKKVPGGVLSPSQNDISEKISGALLAHLQDQRYGKPDEPHRGHRKRLFVSPGKSVGSSDILQHLQAKAKATEASSSEGENDDSSDADDVQPLDTSSGESEQDNQDISKIEPEVGDWVLIKRHTKRSRQFSVGQVDFIMHGELCVKFAKPQECGRRFQWPEKDKIEAFDYDEVEKILPKPRKAKNFFIFNNLGDIKVV